MTPPVEPDVAAEPSVAHEQGARVARPAYNAGSLRPLFVSPRGITRCAAAGFVASTLASWIALGVHVAHLLELQKQLSGSGGDAGQLATIAATLRIAQGMQIAVFAITAVFFLAWLFRLRINVRALGVRKLEFSRRWSLLGFFVPVLNVVRPYQVIAEVWRASDPSVLDPFEWKSVEAPQILALWWGTFVIAVTLELTAFGFHLTAGEPGFKSVVASSVAIVANLAAAVCASIGFFLVNRLTATQIAKRERLQGEADRA
jgi:hypothetical protein